MVNFFATYEMSFFACFVHQRADAAVFVQVTYHFCFLLLLLMFVVQIRDCIMSVDDRIYIRYTTVAQF